MTHAICVWDATLKADVADVSAVRKSLTELSKKWVFQKEKGESGYEHYQIRLSLFKKLRKSDCYALFKDSADWWSSVQLSPTSKKVADAVKKGGGFNYVMKLDSRLDGPWSDKDPVPLVEPRQSREFTTLLPWQ